MRTVEKMAAELRDRGFVVMPMLSQHGQADRLYIDGAATLGRFIPEGWLLVALDNGAFELIPPRFRYTAAELRKAF